MSIWTLIAVAVVVLVVVVLWLFNVYYRRATKELAFVRTGLGGQKVVIGGGSFVFPVFHDAIPVNLSTLRLEVRRNREGALITSDRLRVDVVVDFYVRVTETPDAVAFAAQTLGRRTMEPDALRELIEGKFVDALRLVAAEMTMEQLHEKRGAFISQVRATVAEELAKNGLELESASLTALDQTNMEFFNPSNAFDAEGLTRLTEEIERRKKVRNDIEQDTLVQIRTKNLEAEKTNLEIERESEYARLAQEKDLEYRRSMNRAEIVRDKAERKQEAEVATILAEQSVEMAAISRKREIAQAEIEERKAIELAEQARTIEISESSAKESAARAKADRAKAEAVTAEEDIYSARELAVAERKKAVELVLTALDNERDQLRRTMAAETEKTVASLRAEAERIEAESFTAATTIKAQGYSKRHAVEAEFARLMAEAENKASDATRATRLRMKLLDRLEGIIRESAKPLDKIGDVRIVHMDGMGAGGSGEHAAVADGGLADQLVTSALKYRAQAPLVDQLLSDIGIEGGDLSKLKSLLDTKQDKGSNG